MSHRMKKTVVVGLERAYMHPVYKKVVRKLTKIKVHDERDECQVGDLVQIRQSRPVSKEKHWRVVEIVRRSEGDVPSGAQEPSALS